MAKTSKTRSRRRKASKDLTPRNGRAVKGGGGQVTAREASKDAPFNAFLKVESLP